MYIYHALINALGAHMIHVNLERIFYTHVEHSPTTTIYLDLVDDAWRPTHHKIICCCCCYYYCCC